MALLQAQGRRIPEAPSGTQRWMSPGSFKTSPSITSSSLLLSTSRGGALQLSTHRNGRQLRVSSQTQGILLALLVPTLLASMLRLCGFQAEASLQRAMYQLFQPRSSILDLLLGGSQVERDDPKVPHLYERLHHRDPREGRVLPQIRCGGRIITPSPRPKRVIWACC